MQQISGNAIDYGLDLKYLQKEDSIIYIKDIIIQAIKKQDIQCFKNKNASELKILYPLSNSRWNFVKLLENEIREQRNFVHKILI